MFAASSRLFILFDGPLSLLHHRPSTLRLSHHQHLSLPLSVVPHHLIHPSRSISHFPTKSSQQFDSRSTSDTPQEDNNVPDGHLVPPSHPWPEWSELLESISIPGYFDPDRYMKDQFVPNESLSMEFVDAACSFLGFANNKPDILGWLSKDDIQVLVDNGTPFLFKNAIEIEKRMRYFLQEGKSSEATTLDLMKYILSYASNPIFYPERNIKEATELCARNLLREMANFNGRELRPQRQLTGNEWDCPKCNFFNYGRNMVCLKCECSRPGEVPLPVRQVKNHGYTPFVPLPDDMFAHKPENTKTKSNVSETNSEKSVAKIENQIKDIAEEQKSEKWFKKVSELHDVTDLTSEISDDDFPEIMPMRKGENRFVVSKKKDRSFNSPTYKRQQAIEQEKSSNFVPFVPFPPDYFAKKDDNQQSISTKYMNLVEETINTQTNRGENGPETLNGDRVNPGNPDFRKGFQGSSLEGSAVKETDPSDMSKGPKASITSNSSRMSHENPIKAANDMNLVKETRNTQVDRIENRPLTLNGDWVNPGNVKLRNGFQGSSLEGSAVKETDPLDMSEEAKVSISTNSSQISHENSVKAANDMNLVEETRHAETNRIENGLGTLNGDRINPGKPNLRNGFQGSSLEGSAVKETDPLDMSEEAKAERWFRRVAQIKDISELSQIPDEDFPSIMPMRKGVNRFVVSKRKTPLERRLSSPEYRKNLRTVRSEPSKKDADGS